MENNISKNRSHNNFFFFLKIFYDKVEIRFPINFGEKNSDLKLARKKMIFLTKIWVMIFIYKKEWFLKKEFQVWFFLLWKRMIFKWRISNLIFKYDEEWVLKKEFQIWPFIMQKMVFKEIISNIILKKEFLKKEFQIWFFIIKKNDF